MSMKNSDTIGDRTRDLPTCNAVPQPSAPSRAPYSSSSNARTNVSNTNATHSTHTYFNFYTIPFLARGSNKHKNSHLLFQQVQMAWQCTGKKPTLVINTLKRQGDSGSTSTSNNTKQHRHIQSFNSIRLSTKDGEWDREEKHLIQYRKLLPLQVNTFFFFTTAFKRFEQNYCLYIMVVSVVPTGS